MGGLGGRGCAPPEPSQMLPGGYLCSTYSRGGLARNNCGAFRFCVAWEHVDVWFPNFAVSLWSDGFHFLRARPHPTDPEQCIFDNWWYASQPESETAPIRTTAGIVERDAEIEHEVFKAGDKSMGRTIDQDVEIFSLQQAGLRSRGYGGAYLADQESRVSRYHDLIDDYIRSGKQELE